MRKNKKGMTVVEVVISFTLISLSFAIGMIGIACGANMINSGARLKHQRSNAVVEMTDTQETIIYVEADGITYTIPAVKQSSEEFVQYRPKP